MALAAVAVKTTKNGFRTLARPFRNEPVRTMAALTDAEPKPASPAWMSWIGVAALVLGVLFTAYQGNEWLTQAVMTSATPADAVVPAPACPGDELAEEGLSLAECEQLAADVRSRIVSSPAWFPGFQAMLAAAGTLLGIASLVVGGALLRYARWAAPAAVAVFGLLVAVDAAGFVGALGTGPILRAAYLPDTLLWLSIHLMLAAAALAGLRAAEAAPASLRAQARADAPARARAPDPAGGRGEYGAFAVLVHWLIAASVFFLFVSSWWMLALPLPSDEMTYREFPFQLHKNIGITLTVLLLALLAVRWRRRRKAAAGPAEPRRTAARLSHLTLYGLILAVSVSGYLSSSYSGWGTTLWWLVDLPYWGREDEALNQIYSDVHLWTCWALLAVIALHIGGALYHGFRNDGVVRRILKL